MVDMFGFVAVRNRDRDMRQKLPMRTSAAPRMSKSAVLLKRSNASPRWRRCATLWVFRSVLSVTRVFVHNMRKSSAR